MRFSIQLRFCSKRKQSAWSSGLSQRPWPWGEVLAYRYACNLINWFASYHWDSKRYFVSCFVSFTVKVQYFEPPERLAGFFKVPDNHTLYYGKPFNRVTKGRRIDHFWVTPSHHFNYLSPNSDQQQFSPNDVHTLSRDKVTRINKMITKEKMPWSFIKFCQLILQKNVWISVWRICMWMLGLKGLKQGWLRRHCYGNDFSFSCKCNSLSQERFCTWSRFENEGFSNSEVAYWLEFSEGLKND